MRRLLYRTMLAAMVLAAAFILWAAWYGYNRGFSRSSRQFVINEFRKRGVELTMRRLTLDPFRGIVAREVRVKDPKNRDKVLAVVDQVVLDINYGNLLHGEPFLNAVGLRDANLELPLDPSDRKSPRVKIRRLDALVLLPPNQVHIDHAEADFYGVRLSLTGRLTNPDRLMRGRKSARSRHAQEMAVKLIDELQKLRLGANPPRIDVRLGGDGADPESIFAEATLWAERVVLDGYQLENIYASLRWEKGVLTLNRCTAADGQGGFDLSGVFTPRTGTGDFQLRSTLNLQSLARAAKLTDVLDEFVFYSPPTLDLSGRLEAGTKGKFALLGRIDASKFGYKSVIFEGLSAGFSWDGARWYVRDFALAHRSGQLSGHALQVPGDFKGTLLSTINPGALLPLTSGKTAEMLRELEFRESPRLQLEVRGPSPDFEACIVTGSLGLGRTEIRGAPLNRASAKLRIEKKAVTYENFRVERKEGIGTGTFTYDFGQHEVRLENVKSSLIPTDVALWIDRRLAADLAPYRFKTPPHLSVNGVVQTAGGKATRLEIGVNAPGGMDYVFLKKNLSFPSVTGRLLFTDGQLRLSNVDAALFGGHLRGEAEISLKKTAPGYSARVTAEKVNFPSVTKLYFNYDTAQGELNGEFEFRARREPRSLQGRGAIRVDDGDVFAIPVLGPLSGILNGIVPGMGYNVARQATSSFEVREGAISTDDFLVQGRGFEMIGGGKLFYLDDKIDFSIRINAQGLPGVLLFPVSKLFEYTAESSLSKPVWRPKRLPAL